MAYGLDDILIRGRIYFLTDSNETIAVQWNGSTFEFVSGSGLGDVKSKSWYIYGDGIPDNPPHNTFVVYSYQRNLYAKDDKGFVYKLIEDESVKLKILAGENISTAYKMVSVDSSGKIVIADNTIETDVDRLLGMAITTGDVNQYVFVITFGYIENSLWSWDVTKPLYLSTSGDIIQTIPSSGETVQIGFPISPTKIHLFINNNASTGDATVTESVVLAEDFTEQGLFGNIYLDGSTPKVRIANAMTGYLANCFLPTTGSTGDAKTVTKIGMNDKLSGLTIGDKYFLDIYNPGKITNTSPTRKNSWVQVIGIATKASSVDFFDPNIYWRKR